MLETDAITKYCPFRLASSLPDATRACMGSACMAWETWQDPIRDENHKITGQKAKEPPQGHCGMIPPELNCLYP